MMKIKFLNIVLYSAILMALAPLWAWANSKDTNINACQALLKAHIYAGDTSESPLKIEWLEEVSKQYHVKLKIKEDGAKLKILEKSEVQPLAAFEDVFENGLYFWLVKGTSRLPHPPKEKDMLQNGAASVAIPLHPEDTKSDQIVFNYRKLNLQNGTHAPVIKSIQVVNAYGTTLETLDTEQLLKDIDSLENPQSYSYVHFEGQKIPFPIFISKQDYQKYHSFFVTFYYNPSKTGGHLRELEELFDVENERQVDTRRRRYRIQNMRRWILERYARYAVIAVSTAGAFWAMGNLPSSDMEFPNIQPAAMEETSPNDFISIAGPTAQIFYYNDEPISVFVLKNMDNQFSILLSPLDWDKVDDTNQIQLTDEQGDVHNFFVVTLSDGNKTLIRLAPPGE